MNVLKEATMCKQSPEELLDLVEKTQNAAELRRLLKGICDCEDCHYGKSADTGAQDPGCCLQHRVEFRNWLMHFMNGIDS